MTFGIQRRGWFVGDHNFRLANQRPRCSYSLLLADTELKRLPLIEGRIQIKMREQTCSFIVQGQACNHCTRFPLRREAARQQHIVDNRQVRDEIELLEDETNVVGTKPITRCRVQCRQIVTQKAQATALRHQYPTEQTEQRTLAATAGAMHEDALTGLNLKVRYIETRIAPR